MRRGIERTFEGISRSFYEWLSSMELSSGRMHANPLVSFFSCITAVSVASFSWKLTQILLSIALSSLILTICDIKGFRRSLKASLIWLSFTSVIVVPRLLQDASAILLPLRVTAAILTLSSFVELVGARRLIWGIDRLLSPLIGENLGTALDLMIIQVGRYVRSLGTILLAKSSRLIERKLFGDYSAISLAASELFLRGPGEAFKLSLVLRSRMPENEVSNSLRDTLVLIVLSLTYILPISA